MMDGAVSNNDASSLSAEILITLFTPKKLQSLHERDGDSAPKGLKGQICGDDVGLKADGELFVACKECAFPVCGTCYEYESREGSQVCPQCKTRFKRLKGCARVAGDEEDDGVDDLENEFSFDGRSRHDLQHALSADAMLHGELWPRLLGLLRFP